MKAQLFLFGKVNEWWKNWWWWTFSHNFPVWKYTTVTNKFFGGNTLELKLTPILFYRSNGVAKKAVIVSSIENLIPVYYKRVTAFSKLKKYFQKDTNRRKNYIMQIRACNILINKIMKPTIGKKPSEQIRVTIK